MTFEAVLWNQKNTCGFCSVLKQIFHLRAHSAHCGVLLLQVSLFFLRENVDTGLHPLKAAQIYVEKNLCLKKKTQNPQQTQKFSVGKEIIVSSKGENAGEGVGASLKSMRSDASGLWFFRQPEGSWGDLYPQPLHAPGRCPLRAREGITGSDRLGRRAYAPVPTLSPELGPLSPSGRTHAPRSGRGPANNHPLGRWHLRHLAPFSHNRHQGREGA